MSSKPSTRSKTLSMDDLDPQQEDAIDALYEGNTLLIAQAGFGKAVVGQTAVQELIDDDVLSRVIIFAPLKVCNLTWMTEWLEWSHLRQPLMAVGDANARRDAVLDQDAEIVVMNLDNLAWFLREFGHDHGFDGILIDEISKIKDPGSATFKKLRHHLKDFAWRCGMSATPVHEAEEDIYTQIFFVDGGEALGRNKERFMRNYFMQTDYKGYNWAFQPGGAERLSEDIKHLVFLADTESYEASLARVEDVIVPVDMGKAAWAAYDDMINTLACDIDGEEIEAPNLAVKQGKLQQICCGAIYQQVPDGLNDKGKPKFRQVTHWIHYAKLQAFGKLVCELGEPIMGVYQFTYELEWLRDAFPDALVLADDPEFAKREWNEGRCRLLLVHPKSAGHGLNLQKGGCRLAWLSPIWSADLWDQTLRRLRRRGQPADIVWRYILLVEGTVERLILNRHTVKEDNAKAFINHIRERQSA